MTYEYPYESSWKLNDPNPAAIQANLAAIQAQNQILGPKISRFSLKQGS